jgi:hypothetical protein
VRYGPILPALLCLLIGLSSADAAGPIGIGVGGGLNLPVAQDDAGSGFLYGARLRIGVASFVAVEPCLSYFRQGDSEVETHGQSVVLDGGQSTALGLNLIIGSVGPPGGMRVYGVIGLASHAMKQEGADDQNRLAISLGPALEAGVGPSLALGLEARLHMISLDGGGARKNIGLSGGLIYYLGRQGR